MPQQRAKTREQPDSAPVTANENREPEVVLASETAIELYTSEDGTITLPVRLDNETVWATQAEVAELFGTTRQNVNMHLLTAYATGEIEKAATSKDFLQVRREGGRDVRRTVTYYDLEAMISVVIGSTRAKACASDGGRVR